MDLIHDGAEAREFLKNDLGDIVVLDINLPDTDGLTILREMRGRNDMRPVLMLTARAETDDKISGLDAGADDYLGKPFEMEEFGARIRVLSRRVSSKPLKVATIGIIRFDKGARTIEAPEGPLDIPRREVALFERLILADGRLVSKKA